MARMMPSGAVALEDGRELFGDDYIMVGDLAEIVDLLVPPPPATCPPPQGQTFIASGGGGGRIGPQGPTGPQGPAGPSGSGGGWTDDGAVVRLTTASDVVVIGAALPFAGEKLAVVGDVRVEGGGVGIGIAPGAFLLNVAGPARIDGKLTVTGPIDPTSLTLSLGGTAHFIEWGGGSTAPLSSPGTGRIIYNEVSNQFEQSLNGAAYAPFGTGATFPLLAPAGSAAAPSYSFTGDTNTGMFSSGADSVDFSAGGTTRLQVTTAGAIVTGKLTVTGSIDPTDIILSGGGTAHFQQWGPGSTAANAPASTGRIRYNEITNTFQMSLSGASYADVAMGTGVAFVQNGNSFGATAVLGTNDGFPLEFETGGISFYRVDSPSGDLVMLADTDFYPAADSTGQLGTATFRFFSASALRYDVFAVAGDANPSARLSSASLQFGAGGGTAPDAVLTRGAANRFDLGGGDSLAIPSGSLFVGASAPFAAELFRVVGDARVEGKLTVTGSFDPTDITLSGGGTAHWQQWGAGSTAPVSSVGTGRIRYNEGTNQFEQSLSGAAYVAFGGGADPTAFHNGGDSFGGAATLGTNDAFSLSIETGGTARVTVGSGGNLDIVSGDFRIGGTTVFEADRDLAVSLTPNVDNTLIVGDNTRRFIAFRAAGVIGYQVFNAGGDANPSMMMNSGGLHFGAGGATAVDVNLSRGAADRLDLAATDVFRLANNGTVAAPSLQIGSASTGLFMPAGLNLGVVAVGVEIFRFSATQLMAAVDGTTALPVYSRLTDLDTGLYFPAANTIGLVTGASERFRVTTTQLTLDFAGGTAAAPALSFTADPDTGLFNQAANVVSLSAGATEGLRQTATQTQHLAGTAAAPSITFLADLNTGIFSSTADQIGFATGGVAKFTIMDNADSLLRSETSFAANPADPATNEQAHWFIFDDGVTRELRIRYRDNTATMRAGSVVLV